MLGVLVIKFERDRIVPEPVWNRDEPVKEKPSPSDPGIRFAVDRDGYLRAQAEAIRAVEDLRNRWEAAGSVRSADPVSVVTGALVVLEELDPDGKPKEETQP